MNTSYENTPPSPDQSRTALFIATTKPEAHPLAAYMVGTGHDATTGTINLHSERLMGVTGSSRSAVKAYRAQIVESAGLIRTGRCTWIFNPEDQERLDCFAPSLDELPALGRLPLLPSVKQWQTVAPARTRRTEELEELSPAERFAVAGATTTDELVLFFLSLPMSLPQDFALLTEIAQNHWSFETGTGTINRDAGTRILGMKRPNGLTAHLEAIRRYGHLNLYRVYGGTIEVELTGYGAEALERFLNP